MRPRSPQGDGPSLEGPLRTEIGAFGASSPSLVDHAIRGPVILTRSVADTFVSLPSDACDRLWARAPRTRAIAVQNDTDI